jgi:hypothetical protein
MKAEAEVNAYTNIHANECDYNSRMRNTDVIYRGSNVGTLRDFNYILI